MADNGFISPEAREFMEENGLGGEEGLLDDGTFQLPRIGSCCRGKVLSGDEKLGKFDPGTRTGGGTRG